MSHESGPSGLSALAKQVSSLIDIRKHNIDPYMGGALIGSQDGCEYWVERTQVDIGHGETEPWDSLVVYKDGKKLVTVADNGAYEVADGLSEDDATEMLEKAPGLLSR